MPSKVSATYNVYGEYSESLCYQSQKNQCCQKCSDTPGKLYIIRDYQFGLRARYDTTQQIHRVVKKSTTTLNL